MGLFKSRVFKPLNAFATPHVLQMSMNDDSHLKSGGSSAFLSLSNYKKKYLKSSLFLFSTLFMYSYHLLFVRSKDYEKEKKNSLWSVFFIHLPSVVISALTFIFLPMIYFSSIYSPIYPLLHIYYSPYNMSILTLSSLL